MHDIVNKHGIVTRGCTYPMIMAASSVLECEFHDLQTLNWRLTQNATWTRPVTLKLNSRPRVVDYFHGFILIQNHEVLIVEVRTGTYPI